jgi:hypothetical protein
MSGRFLLPFALASLAACAVAAVSYALVSALPQPTKSELLGVQVLRSLETSRGHGAVISLAGERVVARCRAISRRRRLITAGSTRLILRGTHVTGAETGPRSLTAYSVEVLESRVAVAELAGSHFLYAAAIKSRLLRGLPVVVGTATVRGAKAYRVLLDDRPRIEVLVSRRRLQPLAARYVSRRLHGSSLLFPMLDRARVAGC